MKGQSTQVGKVSILLAVHEYEVLGKYLFWLKQACFFTEFNTLYLLEHELT